MMKIVPIPMTDLLADMEKLGICKNLKTLARLGLPGTHSLQENVSFNFCATMKTSNVNWYVCRRLTSLTPHYSKSKANADNS